MSVDRFGSSARMRSRSQTSSPGMFRAIPCSRCSSRGRALFVAEGDGQFADALETEPQFLAQVIPKLVAPPFQVALQGAGRTVMARMDDAAVRLAGPETDLAFLFQQTDFQLESGEFARDGASDYTAPDDCYIVVHSPADPFTGSPSLMVSPRPSVLPAENLTTIAFWQICVFDHIFSFSKTLA